MTIPRYSTSRKKACEQCCKAKARCVPGTASCMRCSRRGEQCRNGPRSSPKTPMDGRDPVGTSGVLQSPNVLPQSVASYDLSWADEVGPGISSEEGTALSASSHDSNAHLAKFSPARQNLAAHTPQGPDTFPSSNCEERFSYDGIEDELICPINADDIQNRWLSSYIPYPGQPVKEYPGKVVGFMSRMLKSYTASAINNRGLPPFVHHSQTVASNACPPLMSCLTLVRLLAKSVPGSQDVAVSTIQHEMRKLHPVSGTCDSVTLLSIFQAYLIYTMALYFSVHDLPKAFMRQSMMTIQDLACASSHQGLVCLAEQRLSRPRWEAWILSEAKRRTLYTMCMFDSILLSREGLPNYLSIELKGLPAPSTQVLWRSHSRKDWERSYNLHLAVWPEEFLRIDELWPLPADLDEAGIGKRGMRVDSWLEDVDEFGTMLFAVTSCTHGS